MEANQAGSSSPLSSIGDQQPASPPLRTKLPLSAVAVSPDTPPASASRARKTRVVASKKRPVKKAAAKRAPKREKKWDAENILIDERSPLASADLRSLLSSPMAWDVLNADDKAEILALFPDQSHVLDPGTEQARPNLTALRNDDTFRHDCATYTGNLSQGRFDPEWLACAWTAHERRKMGDFDEHLNNKFEYEWQVDLPEDFMPKRVPPSIETEGDMGENGQPGSKDTHENLAQDEDGEKHEEGQDSENHFTDDHEESAAKSGDDAAEQGDCTDSMVIDELQAEGGRPSAHIMPIVRRQSTKMDIVGTESEDELA